LFDLIKNLIFHKKPKKLTISDGFTPYVAQRYLSFNIEESYIVLLNENVNTNNYLHKHPQFFYDYCLRVFPKVPGYFAKYVKADKPEREKKLDNLEQCAYDLGITRKQLREYLEIDPTILDKYNQSQDLYTVKTRK
jgi:hypothetical protein